MKLTKEIKLEDSKKCDGCPFSRYENIEGIEFCGCEYNPTYKPEIDIVYGYICRPQSCIKLNGD